MLVGAQAGPILDRLRRPSETVHAPHLLDLEIAQTLRGSILRGQITAAHGRQALDAFRDMAITRYAHSPLLPRIWELRATITAYDAAYVALAESLGAPLLTRDGRLGRAPGHRALVEVM